jgi:hypothetical protein
MSMVADALSDHPTVPDRERALGVAAFRPAEPAGADAKAAVSVAKAVAKWDALDLEAAIDQARVCGGMVRSNGEWLAHPHGQVLAAKPIVEVVKIGDSDPEPLTRGGRPSSDICAFDLTRPDRWLLARSLSMEQTF